MEDPMRHTDVTSSSGPYTAAPGAVPAADRVTRVASRPLWRLLDVLFSAMERRKQRHALMRLDDHQLKDIGVSRSEVEQEVSKPFWRG
ncbi:DUF1127 domain-containing protein (plasmid) [Azospirillum oryzae]|uniref:DUF1127 domain-containing protein n=2 Tax=Azospirillum oryzae TaxID=286727 RepID=A0A6N1AF59_9PROT|nr:DUF1127 domain-containing protein [Azospirillum oryzae]QKS50315.1 DUF1127 domain-containing protein [Azospirillum oryzae]